MISPNASISGASIRRWSFYFMPRSPPPAAAYFLRFEVLSPRCALQLVLQRVRGRVLLRTFYFHSQTFETVLPELSTSYSNAPHALFSRASFCEAVLKNNIPR
jgi:hypothetical protein